MHFTPSPHSGQALSRRDAKYRGEYQARRFQRLPEDLILPIRYKEIRIPRSAVMTV
jgi:hypothetical protein